MPPAELTDCKRTYSQRRQIDEQQTVGIGILSLTDGFSCTGSRCDSKSLVPRMSTCGATREINPTPVGHAIRDCARRPKAPTTHRDTTNRQSALCKTPRETSQNTYNRTGGGSTRSNNTHTLRFKCHNGQARVAAIMLAQHTQHRTKQGTSNA